MLNQYGILACDECGSDENVMRREFPPFDRCTACASRPLSEATIRARLGLMDPDAYEAKVRADPDHRAVACQYPTEAARRTGRTTRMLVSALAAASAGKSVHVDGAYPAQTLALGEQARAWAARCGIDPKRIKVKGDLVESADVSFLDHFVEEQRATSLPPGCTKTAGVTVINPLPGCSDCAVAALGTFRPLHNRYLCDACLAPRETKRKAALLARVCTATTLVSDEFGSKEWCGQHGVVETPDGWRCQEHRPKMTAFGEEVARQQDAAIHRAILSLAQASILRAPERVVDVACGRRFGMAAGEFVVGPPAGAQCPRCGLGNWERDAATRRTLCACGFYVTDADVDEGGDLGLKIAWKRWPDRAAYPNRQVAWLKRFAKKLGKEVTMTPLEREEMNALRGLAAQEMGRAAAAEKDLERERIRLAGCGIAALGHGADDVNPGDWAHSASLDDVKGLRKRWLAAEEARAAAAAARPAPKCADSPALCYGEVTPMVSFKALLCTKHARERMLKKYARPGIGRRVAKWAAVALLASGLGLGAGWAYQNAPRHAEAVWPATGPADIVSLSPEPSLPWIVKRVCTVCDGDFTEREGCAHQPTLGTDEEAF